jgi:Peptidase M76 family
MESRKNSCSVRECEKVVENFYKSESKVNVLSSKILNRPHISCQDCSKTAPDMNNTTRAAIRDKFPLEIVVCCDRLEESKLEEVLIHELVHAYDYSYNRCNFSTCAGLAYSEIRAAREAECSKGFYPFEFMRQMCVRDVAIRSTSNLFPEADATTCVDAAMPMAIKDLEPFTAARSEK